MWGYLAAYLVVLLSFTAIWFRHFGLLYLGRDADLSLWLGKAYLDWAQPLDVTAMNPLQGMTSMLMAINPYFNPAVWIFQTDIPETSKQVVSFTIYFTEVTLSAFALGWALGFSRPFAFAASLWLAVLLFPPPFRTLMDVIFCGHTYHLVHHLYPRVPFFRYRTAWEALKGELLTLNPKIREFSL